MAQVLVTESYISDIASAIRAKNGQSASYTPSQMASAIASIISAGALSIISKAILSNGSYSAAGDSADAFSSVVVNVPNTYSAADEGKVVLSGALSVQGSMSISVNSSYDTTAFSSVVVDVPNTYSAADEGKVVASGALSAQGSLSVVSNSVYDTTLISQVSVAIPEPVYVSKTISENGEYDPASDNVDAFSHITVNVSGGGSSPVLVSKSISQNGTYNPADDNADAYSQVVVSVSSGGGGSPYRDAFCVMDFTKRSIVAGGVTYNSTGAVFSSTVNAIYLNAVSNEMTAYIDVSMMQLSSGTHRRFLMGTPDKGLIYRNTGKWAFYNGGWEDFDETDGSLFDNCTVKLYVDSNKFWHIYKNGSLLFEPSTSLLLSFGNASMTQGIWAIGAASQGINNAIITGARLYSGSYTED